METSTVTSMPIPPFRPTAGEAAIFKAKPRISSYEWAKKNLRIIAGPYKGHLWNPDVSPQARGVLDIMDRPSVREGFYIAPSQSTKTTTAHAFFFAQLARRSDTWGIGMADQEAARRAFTGKLHQYFTRSPALRTMLASGHDSLNNSEISLADGSMIYAMWSGSESRMRSDSMPYVHIDEEDAYQDPSAALLMTERADAYHALGRSKILHTCRPKGNEDQSVIWTSARSRAQAWLMYEVECPVCHEYQIMIPERIVAVDGSHDPKRIRQEKLGRYQCEHCKALWTDSGRNMAAKQGRWKAVEGGLHGATIVAFHFRSWESTLVSLSDVLAKWFEAQGNPRLMQAWDNNECAKPYTFVSIEADEQKLQRFINDELPQGIVPDWAIALTFSADMQKDYFLWSVCAHGLGPERMHIVDYGRVQTWDELSTVIFQSRYTSLDGKRQMGIWRAALDTGGSKHEENVSRPMQAYKWLLSQRLGVVYGTKGMSRASAGVFIKSSPLDSLPNGSKLKTPYVLHLIDGDALKRVLFWRLGEGCEEEPISFHSQTDRDYLRQIASERLEKGKDGQEKWVRFRGNHYLDCLVGHAAMVHWQWKPNLSTIARQAEIRPRAMPEHESQEVNPYTGGLELFGGGR
ncbi:MAG: terminase gpA endonuclease subunit [Pseudomonadota bacterium]